MRRGVRLGVDVGAVRVGLAASDPDGLIATPVQTLARDLAGSGDLHQIAAEVRERRALEVLVGLPRSLSGAEGPAAVAAREYAGALAALVEVPVRMVDERLSTVEATRSLRESGVKGRKQRARIDQAAAVVLLQTALETERASGRPAGSLVQQVPSPGRDRRDGATSARPLRRPAAASGAPTGTEGVDADA